MKSRGGGYTLVEVLIFIGLTSALLIVAVANISGNQRATQFSQSVRDFESRVRDIVNDVPTGYFPTNSTIGCRIVGGPEVFTSGTPTNLGGNPDCLYVGKAMQFAPNGDDEKMLLYTLAGRRVTAAGDTVKTIDEAEPIAVARPGDGSFTDSVEEVNLRFGVRVRKVFNADTPLNTYGIVGVLSRFEGSTPTNETSEAQAVQIGGIVGSDLNISEADAVNVYMNNLTGNAAVNPGGLESAQDGIVICLIDDANRKASLTIGAGGSAGVRLNIDDYNVGCD